LDRGVENVHEEELHNSYPAPNRVPLGPSNQGLREAWGLHNVLRPENTQNFQYENLNKPLGLHGDRWRDIIKMDLKNSVTVLKKIGCGAAE
jgi:hypothetical protein